MDAYSLWNNPWFGGVNLCLRHIHLLLPAESVWTEHICCVGHNPALHVFSLASSITSHFTCGGMVVEVEESSSIQRHCWTDVEPKT